MSNPVFDSLIHEIETHRIPTLEAQIDIIESGTHYYSRKAGEQDSDVTAEILKRAKDNLADYQGLLAKLKSGQTP